MLIYQALDIVANVTAIIGLIFMHRKIKNGELHEISKKTFWIMVALVGICFAKMVVSIIIGQPLALRDGINFIFGGMCIAVNFFVPEE